MLIIIISPFGELTIMKWTFLSLVIFLALKFTLSDINKATLVSFWLALAWFTFLYTFIFVFIFKVVFYRQHIVGSCFFCIQSISAFNRDVETILFNEIFDVVGFSIYQLAICCLFAPSGLCFLFLLVLSSFNYFYDSMFSPLSASWFCLFVYCFWWLL